MVGHHDDHKARQLGPGFDLCADKSSWNQGLFFVQTVNGSPHGGMDMTNKLHEGNKCTHSVQTGAKMLRQFLGGDGVGHCI